MYLSYVLLIMRGYIVINLVEVAWEKGSFGNGEAQYMDT
jgi:hypothetical protein